MNVETRIGTIKTVAGQGAAGYSGDHGPATAACLNEPKALAFDGANNLFIADSENHVIRKVDRVSGVIRTLAGGPTTPELQGREAQQVTTRTDEDPFSEGTVATGQAFVQQADLSGTVRYVMNGPRATERFGGDGGPALHALLNFPTAIAVDMHGHLYIADTLNHRIRRIDAVTGVISTIAGVGLPRFSGDGGPSDKAGLNEPAALAVQGGRLYIADQSNNRIRMIDLATGIMTSVAGTGSAVYNGDGIPATEASLAGPSGLAVARDGTLYIADTFNGRIRAVNPMTGMITTMVGDGGEYRYQGPMEVPSVSLSRPSGIAVDLAGNLLITDSDNHLVRRWDRSTARIDRLAGMGESSDKGDGGPALEAGLSYPFGIAIDGDGHVVVADTFNHRIREITL